MMGEIPVNVVCLSGQLHDHESLLLLLLQSCLTRRPRSFAGRTRPRSFAASPDPTILCPAQPDLTPLDAATAAATAATTAAATATAATATAAATVAATVAATAAAA